MSYADDRDRDRCYRPRYDTFSSQPRDTDPYSPRYAPPSAPREKPAMRGAMNGFPVPTTTPSRHGPRTRKPVWPPSPAVQDESVAAKSEVASAVVGSDEGEPPINTRGTVDQAYLLDEIVNQPKQHDTEDQSSGRVSASRDNGLGAAPAADRGRRKSFAERGNMAHLRTDVESDPILFTNRLSTPYSYTPQKEPVAPSPAGFMLSPEPITPAHTSTPSTTASRDGRHAQKDQHQRPPQSLPVRTRRDSFTRPPPQSASNDVFDESASASETDDSAHLRINQRKPARYSFVKSDSQGDDLRASLQQNQPRSEPEPSRPTARTGYDHSSGSPKDKSYYHSPRSSSSSVNSEKRKSRPAPVDTGFANTSRHSSRPSSPMHRAPSPKLPSRLRHSPPTSRPSSRGNATRPASPLAWSTTISPPSPRQVPITEADWHSTYPPANANDRSRPPSRFGRHETIQIPTPRVDVQSPSPVRPSNPLPYPVEHHHADVWMPGEELYQFDHSTVSSPRQAFREAPRVASPSTASSRQGDSFRERAPRPRTPRPEEAPRKRRSRSTSVDSKHSSDGRIKTSRTIALIDRPLPNCSRPTATDRHDDWYSLLGYRNFDVCPLCYDQVFADTPFARDFAQTRKYERPTERFCDFSSAWTRLAWLLTIKQRRQSIDLIYALADIADSERVCPGEREVSTERMSWYGIADPRDGLHVANFAVCSADVKNLEALFPSIRGYLTRLPPSPSSSYSIDKHTCSLRTSSRRFPEYLDLIVSLDADAQSSTQRLNTAPLVQLARQHAFKRECARNKAFVRKAWHFIPALPEFTVCQECYEACIWPRVGALPRRVNKSIQLVPGEHLEWGSACVLYSARMRRVWDVSVRDDDFAYLERKVLDRRRKEIIFTKERRGVLQWLAGLDKGTRAYERAKEELKALENEWKDCE